MQYKNATNAQMKNIYQIFSMMNCTETFLHRRKESAKISLYKEFKNSSSVNLWRYFLIHS